jgi:hypothetical protein
VTRNLTHPVWDLHNEYRTTRLNLKYYAAQLTSTERWNSGMELTLAATASGSGLTALSVIKTPVGSVVWGTLTAASALLSVARPVLKLTERIRKLEALATGYRLLDHEYRKLEVDLRERQAYDDILYQRFQRLLDSAKALDSKNPDHGLNAMLRARLMDEVEHELPAKDFFVPEV